MLLLKLLYRPRSQSTVEIFAAKAGIAGRCEHLHTAHLAPCEWYGMRLPHQSAELRTSNTPSATASRLTSNVPPPRSNASTSVRSSPSSR